MDKIAVIGAGPIGILMAKFLIEKGFKPDIIEAGGWDKEDLLTLKNYKFQSGHKVPENVRLVGGQSTKWFGRVSLFPHDAYVNRSGIEGHDWLVPYSEIESSYKYISEIIGLKIKVDREDQIHSCEHCKELIDQVLFDFMENPNVFKDFLGEMVESEKVKLLTSKLCLKLEEDGDQIRAHFLSSIKDGHQIVTENYDRVFICCGTLDSTRLVLNSFPQLEKKSSAGKFFMDHFDGYVGTLLIGRENLQCLKNFALGTDRRLPVNNFGLGISKSSNKIKWHIEICPPVRVYLFDPVTNRFNRIPALVSKFLFSLERILTFLPNRSFKLWKRVKGIETFSLWLRAEELPNSISSLGLEDQIDALGIRSLIYRHKVSFQTNRCLQIALSSFAKSINRGKLGRLRYFWWLSIPGQFNLGGNNHPMGTLSMGSTDDFPVNEELKLKIAKNISVISGSVFPSGGHQNPTALVMCLALITANKVPEIQ